MRELFYNCQNITLLYDNVFFIFQLYFISCIFGVDYLISLFQHIVLLVNLHAELRVNIYVAHPVFIGDFILPIMRFFLVFSYILTHF